MKPRTKALLQTAILSAVISGVIVAIFLMREALPSAWHGLGLFSWLTAVFFVGFALMLGAYRK